MKTSIEASRSFAEFAKNETVLTSPLYSFLSAQIAEDEAILEIAAFASPLHLAPIILLGAVHFLLSGSAHAALARFYPSLTSAPDAFENAYPDFRQFCLENRASLISLLQSKQVQTNEVRRCACLLPAFGFVMEKTDNAPLIMIEVGASAGINLFWREFCYDYSNGQQWGSAVSAVQLKCDARGVNPLPLPRNRPTLIQNIGLELKPVDLLCEEDVRWLRALIWPDHLERAKLFTKALSIVRGKPLEVIAGDALQTLPAILEALPTHGTVCLYHSLVLNQFPPEAQKEFDLILKTASRNRDLYCIGMGDNRHNEDELTLASYHYGVEKVVSLAKCQAHGAWIEWLIPADSN